MIEALPDLKLLITTGMRNASIDVAAAKERGVVVCGTGSFGNPTVRHRDRPDAGAYPPHRLRKRAPESRRSRGRLRSASTSRARRSALLGLGKLGTRMAEIGQAFGMSVIAWSQNLTAEKCKEVGAELRRPRMICFARGLPLDSSASVRAHARPDRRARTRPDEADRVYRSTPRAARSSTRPRCWRPSRASRSPAPGSTSSTSSRCRPIIRCAPSTTSC